MIFGKHMNKYYVKYGGWLLLGLVVLIAIDYAELIIPNLYQMVINGLGSGYVVVDGVTMPFDLNFLLDRICMPMAIVILVVLAGQFLWRICFFGSAIKVEADIRNAMFDHAKDLSQQYYHVNKVGDLMSLFTNDLDTVQDCFGSGMLMLFDALIMGSLSFTKMWRMNRTMTLFALIPMALLLAASTVVGKHMMKKWDIRQAAFSKLSDFSQESFTGIAVIKAFVKEAKELMAFQELNKENEKANVDYTRSSVLLRIIVSLLVESVICIIIGFGGFLVWQGTFNAGQLVEFIGYFSSIVWPIMAISELIDMTSRGMASLKRISTLLDAPLDMVDRPDVQPLKDVQGEIEFRHLTFRYPDGEYDALKDVSFKIEAGENIGLVGRTGSGKTTVVDLILRTYNVPDGTVFVDGHDVNSVPIWDVRQAAAYVPQDNFLFSDTITRNIGFTTSKPDLGAVKNAAMLADVDDNIREFAEGYDTVLGERGVTVSGGQKQRISIARVFLKNPPILILDEATSALDNESERHIQKSLEELSRNRTTITIAHRLSTIRSADEIIVIDGQGIVERGNHRELLEKNGLYARYYEMQFEGLEEA